MAFFDDLETRSSDQRSTENAALLKVSLIWLLISMAIKLRLVALIFQNLNL